MFYCFVAQLLRSIVVAASEIEGALAQLLRKPGKMVYRYDKDWGEGAGITRSLQQENNLCRKFVPSQI